MVKFNHQIDYEPSKQILKFWLFSRKAKYQLQLVQLPGLFQTKNYLLDLIAFVLVLVCEFIGLMNLMIVSQDFKIIYVWGLFLADILFAILYHLPVSKKLLT